MLNLAINARDAMDGGGKLTIDAGNIGVRAGDATRRQPDLPAGDYVLLAMSATPAAA